jgi:hypothetical protein
MLWHHWPRQALLVGVQRLLLMGFVVRPTDTYPRNVRTVHNKAQETYEYYLYLLIPGYVHP